MTRETLADRLIVYSDTVVAFGLVNGFAFLITLGDPDIRCSIAAVAGFTLGANVLLPIASTWALVWLRRYEARLRAGSTSSADVAPAAARSVDAVEPAVDGESATVAETPRAVDAVSDDPMIEGFWRRLFVVRVGLIWVSAVIVLTGVFAATHDVRCAAALAGAG